MGNTFYLLKFGDVSTGDIRSMEMRDYTDRYQDDPKVFARYRYNVIEAASGKRCAGSLENIKSLERVDDSGVIETLITDGVISDTARVVE